MKGDGKESM